MRIKKWEKWYWGIVVAIIISFLIYIVLRGNGFEIIVNGKPEILSKTKSFLWCILFPISLSSLWIWFVLRFWFLKTNEFICKVCRKEFGGSFETEKETCKTCYEKRRR